jgi:hypothetical protein
MEKIPAHYAGAYRNFVTGKYHKYKEEQPAMSDKQILDCILKEWQGLSESQKHSLRIEYVDNNNTGSKEKSKSKSATKDKS